MFAVITTLVFLSALGVSLAVLIGTLVPAFPRIVAVLRDGSDAKAPAVATISEPRLRARIRASSVQAPATWRAAA